LKKVIKNTTMADRLLFLFLMAISVSGILYTREAVSQSSDVVIELDGKPQYTFPLNIDRTVLVTGPIGKAIIEIKGGKVRIAEAPCPNQICVREGWISRGAVVCVPNRLVVLIGGGNKPYKDIDAVSG
jgi:hypothetical protein